MRLEDLPQGLHLNFPTVSVTGTEHKVQVARGSHQLLLQSRGHQGVDQQWARMSSLALQCLVAALPVLEVYALGFAFLLQEPEHNL